MKNPIFPHLILLSVTIVFGANYVIAKNVLDPEYINPFGFTLFRVSFGVAFLWILHAIFFKERIERRDFPLLFLCAVFGIAINQLLFFKGLQLTSPMNASLIVMVCPLLVVIFSAFLLRDRVTFRKVLGIILGGAGASMILLSNQNLQSSESGLLGDTFILLNATSYAIYFVLVKTLMKKYSAFTVIKWLFTFGFFMILPFGWNGSGSFFDNLGDKTIYDEFDLSAVIAVK